MNAIRASAVRMNMDSDSDPTPEPFDGVVVPSNRFKDENGEILFVPDNMKMPEIPDELTGMRGKIVPTCSNGEYLAKKI